MSSTNRKYKKPSSPNTKKVEDIAALYQKTEIQVYNSYSDKLSQDLIYVAGLNPLQRLQQLRQLINLAYGMHGYDPENIPTLHRISIGK